MSSDRPVASGAPTTPSGAPAPDAVHPLRRWTVFAIRILISAALVVLLLRWADVGEVASTLGNASIGFLGLALISMLVERIYAAYRWKLLVQGPLPDVTLADLLRITFASNFLGMFLPGGSIELARVIGLARRHASRAEALGSVVLDRVLGLGALLTTAGICAGVTGTPMPAALRAPILVGVTGCIVGLAVTLPRRPRHAMVRLLSGRIPAFGERAMLRLSAYLDSIGNRPGLLFAAILHAFGIQIVRIVSVALALWAVGADVSLATCAAYVPLIIIAQLLPIGIGGLGIREAAFAYFFGLADVPSATAIGASLLVYILTAISVLPGAWVLASALARNRKLQRKST